MYNDIKRTRGKDNEYLVALWERDNLSHKDRITKVNIDEIVMIKGESVNRGHCRIGKVSQMRE